MEQINIAEAAGKTIKVCVPKWDDSELLLVYEDGTYSILEVQLGYDQGDAYIVDGCLDVLQFWDAALVEAGVLDAEEARELREKDEAACEAAALEVERQQYERLKLKFGHNT